MIRADDGLGMLLGNTTKYTGSRLTSPLLYQFCTLDFRFKVRIGLSQLTPAAACSKMER